MKILEFDTVILGGGPAGFSAGLYASRGAAKTAIVDISMFGGQPSNYLELENYPGFSKIGGYDLMEKFEAHADMFGVQKFPMQEIESVDLISNPKIIKTKENESRLLVNMEASIELEDDIYRSLGILQNCRIISVQEAMKHLSNIKLGIEMDYIKDISLEKVINLMTGMKPIMELMSPMTSDGDIKRADFLREEFTLANRNKK